MKELPVGMYIPGASPLHRLDARIKLIGFLLLLAAAVATDTLYGYGFMALVTTVILILSKFPLSVCLSSVRRLWLFFLLIFVMNTCFYAGEDPWVAWWIFRPSMAGLLQATNVVCRMLLALVLSNVLTCTTPPMDITAALESLLRPLRLVRIPTEQIAMILSVAIGFIPTLFEETAMIRKAQTARGARFDSRKLTEKASAVLPLVVPVFLAAFKRADELAMAMEARGYRGGSASRKRRMKLPLRQLWVLIPVATLAVIQIIFL